MKNTIRIIIAYILTAFFLKVFGIIETPVLHLASPFIFAVVVSLLYFLIIFSSVAAYNYRSKVNQEKEDFDTELSFLCHGCGKPFDKPVRHGKEEFVYHKHCTPKSK